VSPSEVAARWLAGLALAFVTSAAHAQGPVRVYAAGSLRPVMLELGAAFEAAGGAKVDYVFGPSGVLRERIEGGEPADVFASADMGHPRRLAEAGRSYRVVPFARNRLCALASPKIEVATTTLLDRMLDPAVKLGMSTPLADPSGDYAVQLFEKAEQLRAGARAALMQKGRRLVGGPDSPPPPKDRNVYAALVDSGEADIFLTYCTNALQAHKENPGLRVVQIPEALAVSAQYGLTVTKGARLYAAHFAEFVLSRKGQDIIARHGFTPLYPDGNDALIQ
jgi:molybdate transport system substrate-binding protein